MVVRLRRWPAEGPVLVAVLALALLGGVGAVALRTAADSVQEQAQRRVRAHTDAAVRALQRQSAQLAQVVEAGAAEPAVRAALAGPGSSAQGTLSTLARTTNAPAAFLTDARGVVVDIYPAQPEVVGRSYAYRDWYAGVRRTDRPYVSSAYRSVAVGHPLVVGVAAPVRAAAGPQAGVLVLLWSLDSVRAVAEGSRQDDGVTVTVTDQSGQPVTGTVAVDDRGQPTPTRVAPETRAALAGRRSSSSADGTLLEAAPVPGLGWTVTATQRVSSALSPLGAFRRSLAETLGLAALVVLALTWLAARLARRSASERAAGDAERRRLAALFAASPIGIIEGLPDGTVLDVNPALSEMLGWSKEELLGMNAADLAHPDSSPAIAGAMQQVLAGAVTSYTSERLYRHRDGSAVPVLVSVVVLRDPDGVLRRMVAFVVDQRQQRADADALAELAGTLAEREAFLATLIDTLGVGVLACDADGHLTRVNAQVRALHGLAADSPPQTALQLAHLDGRPMDVADSPLLRALHEGDVHDTEVLALPADGGPPVRLLTHARRLTGDDGGTVGAVVAVHDVTAVRATEAALRASEERFRRAFDEDLAGKALVDPDGHVVRVNATLAAVLRRTADELVGQSFTDLLADPAAREAVQQVLDGRVSTLRQEMALAGPPDDEVWALVALSGLTDSGGRRLLMAQVEDVTARRRAEQRLTELALHDELTGLPNRRLLLERCLQAFEVARSGRAGSRVTLLFVDLDGFKPVNDRAGHDAGDRLLAAIAQDLRHVLRPTDTVARVGGDEFVVLLGEDEGLTYARTVADRVATTVRRQVVVEGAALTVTASTGIAQADLAHEPGLQPEQLLRRADAAMYRAKERGRDRHEVFDVDLHETTEVRRELEQAVREALAGDGVSVVYQPVVDVDSGLVVGAEALLRVRGRDGRLLPTLPLVVAAENAGLVEALGDRVLDRALADAAGWSASVSIAVNLSSRELTGRDLRTRVERALRRHGVDPGRLVLEITESSVLAAGPSARRELEQLRRRGVRIAIDDFGTAYATLQNLTALPVDVLKVDASFTAGLPGERSHTAVVHGVASMAYELDIPCVVEGVETAEQLAALRGLSVQAQGWLWGQPVGEGQPLPVAVPVG